MSNAWRASSVTTVTGVIIYVILTINSVANDGGRAFAAAADAFRVSALAGGGAELPCDTRPPDDSDTLLLVVWYREDVPIYSYDGRVKGSQAHWSDDALKGRARWQAHAPSALHLSNADPADAADYRCRVDFQVSPTRNYRIKLDVIELSGVPSILDEYGKELTGTTGPYHEGGYFQLTCITKGGNPTPSLRWWRDDIVLASSEVHHGVSESRTLQLRVQNLTREHLHAAYTCTAENTALAPPKRTTVEVELYLRPLSVEILPREHPLSVAREAEVACRSAGARPPATLSWWLHDRQLTTVDKQQDSSGGNETLSILRWTPQLENNGAVLSCRANHQTLDKLYMESRLVLNIHFVPIVHLQLGSKLNPNDIEEGDDVYFECSVTANPQEYKVVWEHNGMVVTHNESAGVIVGTRSLVLQKASKRQAGRYICNAFNVEGDGRSQAVNLQIMYKPVCRSESPVLVGVALQETVRVLCEVEAHPPPDAFHWTLNNSAGAFEVDSARFKVESAAGRSTLVFAPAAETDYGVLSCRASNLAGQQRSPCRYTLRPAAPPDPPRNCFTTNITDDSLELHCEPGYDGGLTPTFVAEAWASEAVLLNNVSSSKSKWHLYSLGAARTIRLVVYAANGRGRSEPVNVRARTLATPHTEAQGGGREYMTWAVGGLLGAVVTVLLITCLATLIARVRQHRSRDYNVSTQATDKTAPTSTRTLLLAPEEKNPDVVPLDRGVISPPEPPPYGTAGGAPSAPPPPPPPSLSAHSLHSQHTHRTHAEHTHKPLSPHEAQCDGVDEWRHIGPEPAPARARREVVTTRTPLLAAAHQESCV